jgi:hypothetical protein
MVELIHLSLNSNVDVTYLRVIIFLVIDDVSLTRESQNQAGSIF